MPNISLNVKRLTLQVIFILFVLSILIFKFALPVSAAPCDNQTTAQDVVNQLNRCAIDQKIFDDKIFNLNQIAGTTDSLYTMLTGKSQLHQETNSVTAHTGALASSGRVVAMLYSSPPASGVQYFARAIDKFNPVQPAYAQTGIGFEALTPVQDVWTGFRNIAYAGFVLIFVVIGFMIMFRAHISPQAVATVQDSVPRVVVALFLVTFSYAIAGLMIDLMFLILNVAFSALDAAIPSFDIGAGNTVIGHNIFYVVFHSWTDTVGAVADAVGAILGGILDLGTLGDILSWFGGGIIGIIAGVAMLFIMFKIFMMLLMAYITIILLTIFAPFFFLFQALPGNNSAMSWFKQMASNVAVFPAVALMLILGGVLSGIGELGGTTNIFTAGDVGHFPLLSGGIPADAIGNLIGIGFLLMTPTAAQMVKDAFGVKGGVGGGAGAAAAAAPIAAAGFLGRRATESSPGQAMSQLGKLKGQERASWIANKAPQIIRGKGDVESRNGVLQRKP